MIFQPGHAAKDERGAVWLAERESLAERKQYAHPLQALTPGCSDQRASLSRWPAAAAARITQSARPGPDSGSLTVL